MAGIQLTGINTGIDTSAIVKQLMEVESQGLNRLNTKLDTQSKVNDALGTLNTDFNTLQDSLDDLSNAEDLRSFQAASSDSDVLTAEASANASEGTHSVVIHQLATPERWVQTAGSEYAEDHVGAGTFIYSYNNQETAITTTSDTTLEDLVGLVNNDANNPGVTASLLEYNNAYHLVLNGADAGSDYQISINSSNTEVWKAASDLTLGGNAADVSTKLVRLDQFSGTLKGDEKITIQGQLHDGTAVNRSFAVTNDTKLSTLLGEINDAFQDTAKATLKDGRIVLTDTTNGTSQMSLTLAYDRGTGTSTLSLPGLSESTEGGSVTSSLSGFAKADFTETQSAQDAKIKVDGYPTGTDEWISRSTNTIDDVISGVTLHLQNTGTVQVTLTRDTASLVQKLQKFVDAYNSVHSFVQDNTKYDSDTKTAGILMTDSTVTSMNGSLQSLLSRKAQGFLLSTDSFLTPGTIGLELDSDGVLSLDSTALDKAIAKDYEGVLDLIGAAKTGSSSSSMVQFYGASSKYTVAGTYDVQVVVSGGVITSARIKSSGDAAYHNATINGNTVEGDGTFDSNGSPVYKENGLQLTVDTSTDGTYAATIQVRQGFAGTMKDLTDKILDTRKGYLTMDQNSVKDNIDSLNDQITKEEDRLEGVQTRLTEKYAKLESTLTTLKGQMASLQSS
jgi:flagellar hook-associated protein 2